MLQLQSTTFSLHLYLILICSNKLKINNTNIEVICAAMNTTEVVVEIMPEKIQASMGFEPMTSAIPVQRSWVQIPYWPEFFSGLISTTSSVVQ